MYTASNSIEFIAPFPCKEELEDALAVDHMMQVWARVGIGLKFIECVDQSEHGVCATKFIFISFLPPYIILYQTIVTFSDELRVHIGNLDALHKYLVQSSRISSTGLPLFFPVVFLFPFKKKPQSSS